MSDEIMKPLEAMKLHTIQGIKGTSTMDQAAYDDAMKLLAQRQADGRYTLEEAAMAVNKATGERADEMLHKFMRAALAGVLLTYEPGKNSRYIYGEGFASCVRDFYEEAIWYELNAWLEANEKRITWRFPEPASQKGGARETAADDTAPPWAGEATSALPVTAKEIAAAFPVKWAKSWPERLRKAAGGKSYQWLAETVVRRGSRKPGDANTYNPAAVAVALVVHKYMTRAACDAAIRRCFPAWLDDWNDKVEYLKL